MKLRDEYSGLDELCASLGIDRASLEERLSAAGFEYDSSLRRFR